MTERHLVSDPPTKAQVSATFGDGEGISSFSKKKGPSWLYLQWASNKMNQTRMLQAAAGAPVRALQLPESVRAGWLRIAPDVLAGNNAGQAEITFAADFAVEFASADPGRRILDLGRRAGQGRQNGRERGMTNPFVLAVPSKGRLQENAEAFFTRAGLMLAKSGGAR